MLLHLNDHLIVSLLKLNVKYYSLAKNFNKPYHNTISSIHFFENNIKDDNDCYSECAYFLPDMHSLSLGKLSGFNKLSRKNNVDKNLFRCENLAEYIYHTAILKSSNGEEALYINHVYINDDNDLPDISNNDFWNLVKEKYRIDKPKTINLSKFDQEVFDMSLKFKDVLERYKDYYSYHKETM